MALDIIGKVIDDKEKAEHIYHVDYLKSRGQLKEVWRIERDFYGTDIILYESLESWWKTYKKGIFIIEKENEGVG